MAMRRLAISLSTLATLGAAPVQGHDRWIDGTSVPAWVKKACCGPSDVHRLAPEQVRHVEGGYRIDGYPRLVPDDQLLPSHDGAWWIFYRTFPNGVSSEAYCFFGPLSS